MSAAAWMAMAARVVLLAGLAVPLGRRMARVYEGRPYGLDRILGPVERLTSPLRPSHSRSKPRRRTLAAATEAMTPT